MKHGHFGPGTVLAAGWFIGSIAIVPAQGINADVKQLLYNEDMLDPQQPVEPSVYRDWQARKAPPWTIGYASSYAGNTWRTAALERLQNDLVPKWQRAGLVKELIVTQSKLDDKLQGTQIRQLVDQGADAIMVCCSNPTGLNDAIRYAYDKGVPTFSFTGYLTSEFAENSSVNYQLAGHRLGEWMANEIGKKGNVLLVEGIPGTSASDSQDRGVKESLSNYPDITVAGDLAGMWTDDVTQAAVEKWLAAHPGKLDGVIVQSASELGVLRAIQKSGRDMMPVTISGELGALCYWRKHPNFVSAAFHVWPPGDDIELSWNIMMRTLEGQGPKLQSILVEPLRFDIAAVNAAVAENCSQDSDKWLSPGPAKWGSDPVYLNSFFERPADPMIFKH